MAYKDFDGLSLDSNTESHKVINGEGHKVELPDASFVRDAALTRDGMNLVLDGPDGRIEINDYFADESQPNLVAPDGWTLTPALVNSFLTSPAEYAANGTISDETPVGAVHEVTGHATVTHTDGSTETIVKGTPIFQGDIVETDAQGAVNITFVDETSFAVSQDARLSIDNYVYDASTQSGSNDFSVLKGVFVFTSGLIGRDDPDDVHINTPVGSIGIRGTIIAGNVDTGEITVIEGAIVLTDHNGNEMTLATQFETARFHGSEGIENLGQLTAQDLSQKFFLVSQVSPTLFSSINDAATEQQDTQPVPEAEQPVEEAPASEESAPVQTDGANHSDTGEVSATTETAALPPVPPPVTTTTTSGLTTTTSGLTATTTATASLTTPSDNTVAPPTTTQTVVNTTAAAASDVLPPPPVTDPNTTTAPGGTTTTNPAPNFHAEAPNSFFTSADNQTWHYNFNKEFADDGGLPNMTFELSAATIAALNTWQTNGVLTAQSFSAATGELQLTFGIGYAAVGPISIEVQARDAQGGVSGFHDFDFNAGRANALTFAGPYLTDNQTISTLTPTTGSISSDSSKFFFGDGNDVITVEYQGTPNNGTNNYVNLGDGINSAILQVGTYDNTVVGGDGRDTITLNTANAEIRGMDNDDEIRLWLDNGSTVLSDLLIAGTGTVIDGGHSNLRVAALLRAEGVTVDGEGDGRGDTLTLMSANAASLDFSLINANNSITSIERIDTITSAQAQTLHLNYNDVLRITDDKNILTFNLGAGDILNLDGMTGMNKVLDGTTDNFQVNDGPQGGTATNRAYDVFTDGTVTILIHNAGGAAVNMDGAPVAI